ncbi:MAG TPA: shikimate dehydrogenase [Terriglobia bacterium]|nr:shikimate dehydrogenase [Terriglobia bacterium]
MKPAQPRIIATVAAPSLNALESIATQVVGSQMGFEFRLDYLQDFAEMELRLRQIFLRLRSPYAIATCRRVEAGGQFPGSVEEQARVLGAAVRAGCAWVDIEAESVEQAGVELLRRFSNSRVVVSVHDFKKLPPLGETYRRLSRLPVHAVKIAGLARSLADNLKVRQFLKAQRPASRRAVVVALGASGLPSRLLGLNWGSAWTFASASPHFSAAPGQLPAEVMRSVYRVESVDHRTQLYGVVGNRASTSLSPAMQNAAFHAKRVNAIYLPCETPRLSDFLAFARKLGFAGFSVTMPFKRAIIRALDWVEPMSAQIGSCNTVAVQRGKWTGWNTDAAAVIEVLTKRLRLAGSRALILGAGGAARSAAFALRGEGAMVFIAARREIAARRLAASVSAQAVPWDSADSLDVDTVINATPIGMAPNVEGLPVDLARLRTRVVFDMVYYPLETRFLAEARGRGLTTISGLEMLVAQGARQFEIWTGQSAPRALMEQAVRQGFGIVEND